MAQNKNSYNYRLMQAILEGKEKPPVQVKAYHGPSESQIQQDLITWFYRQYPRFAEKGYLFHIPNEGQRSGRNGARLVKEGVVRGVADLCLAIPRKGYGVLWIEMKKKGGRLSPEQKSWGMHQTEIGNKYAVCYSLEEGIDEINSYLL